MVDAFDTLNPESPLIECIEYVKHDQPQECISKAVELIKSRQESLPN